MYTCIDGQHFLIASTTFKWRHLVVHDTAEVEVGTWASMDVHLVSELGTVAGVKRGVM